MALMRQSRPDSGRGFQVKVLKPFYGVASSVGSGPQRDFKERGLCPCRRATLDMAWVHFQFVSKINMYEIDNLYPKSICIKSQFVSKVNLYEIDGRVGSNKCLSILRGGSGDAGPGGCEDPRPHAWSMFIRGNLFFFRLTSAKITTQMF